MLALLSIQSLSYSLDSIHQGSLPLFEACNVLGCLQVCDFGLASKLEAGESHVGAPDPGEEVATQQAAAMAAQDNTRACTLTV
jgi:hypothetical protein